MRKRDATHKAPDVDAIVSVWLAKRHLFRNDLTRVEFVGRQSSAAILANYDAVVDVGRHYDKEQFRFDHKPPAFSNRDETCASRLVWDKLQENGEELDHLEPMIDVVHDGDAVSRRHSSEAYQVSRSSGLHSHFSCLRQIAESDNMLCSSMIMWLDALADVPLNNSST